MKLEHAERIAAALVEQLAPFCELAPIQLYPGGPSTPLGTTTALAVVGSIRRRRPEVNDIDLVAIPQLATIKTGLFEEGTQPPEESNLAVALCSVLAKPGKVLARGDKIIRIVAPVPDQLVAEIPAAIVAEGVSVDVYLATPETWATTLLIRTGSKEHNIWLCQRARELGGKLHASGEGLELPGFYNHVKQCMGPPRKVTPLNEPEIFRDLLCPEKPGPHNSLYAAPPCWDPVVGIPPEFREVSNGRPAWLAAAKAGGAK